MKRVWSAAAALMATPVWSAPAEPPPAGYARSEYVDSAGCAFQRVELGDDVLWAERSYADGKPVCDLVPSLSAQVGSDALPSIPPHRRGTAPEFSAPGRYIQIGAFRRTADADSVSEALMAQGLPLIRQDFRSRGAPLRLLYAGPFATEEAALRARDAVRKLGYLDAFFRIQD